LLTWICFASALPPGGAGRRVLAATSSGPERGTAACCQDAHSVWRHRHRRHRPAGWCSWPP